MQEVTTRDVGGEVRRWSPSGCTRKADVMLRAQESEVSERPSVRATVNSWLRLDDDVTLCE